ncbi:transcriptional regulator with XRE-family HTH domain [Sporomusaceae bacterium BoRhaA]|uniref:helix-turn-helix domain-containing protein n=1 Tax=Pelorhabdus rhamnosifermentans TaxID=2772457 RepID=UPI001C0624EC|nr:helix-turn-helix transcriptional regulator [Pelorhabdus rhamnosifermentans]MBU2702815.1 transcriptional regulator with XRE-family HTH domain [Pelorhabdus rhamnosifermentans]
MQDYQASPEIKEIIERLKTVRKNSGLSQANFAKELGVSQGNVGTWETGGSLPGALALKTIAQKFDCSIDWILLGIEKDMQQQKSEAISDPDLKDMIAILRNLMESDDSDLRVWAKVQFKNAFKEYCDEKKP